MFKRDDWIFGLVASAVGIFVVLYSRTIDRVTSMDPAGPAAMPRLVGWMMILIGAAHLVGAYLAGKKDDGLKPKKKDGSVVPVILICAACGAYLFLLESIGYLLLTPLLIIAIMTGVGDRKIPRILGMSVGMTALLFGVFSYVLGVRLPIGILGRFLG